MAHKGIKWLLAAWLGAAAPAVADTQFGVYGLQSQTNHDDLPNPAGIGAFIQQRLASRTALRLSYSWAGDEDRYSASFLRRSGYFLEIDTVKDLWEERTSMAIGEIALLVSPVVSEPLSLHLGVSLGRIRFYQNIAGRTTGLFDEARTKNRYIFGLLADIEIAYTEIRPFVIHFTIRERTTFGASTQLAAGPDDSPTFDPYSGFSADFISNAEMAVAIALRL